MKKQRANKAERGAKETKPAGSRGAVSASPNLRAQSRMLDSKTSREQEQPTFWDVARSTRIRIRRAKEAGAGLSEDEQNALDSRLWELSSAYRPQGSREEELLSEIEKLLESGANPRDKRTFKSGGFREYFFGITPIQNALFGGFNSAASLMCRYVE
jgi:hypothetical protein